MATPWTRDSGQGRQLATNKGPQPVVSSRSGRRKNRCKRDINLPVFISSGNHGNIFNNPHRPGFGNSSDHSHYPSNINLNNNSPTTTSIINSINSIRTHILNNAHLHSHYHPQFQHHQHHHHHHHHQHRRRQLCECCPTLSLPTTTLSTARSRNTITKEDVKSSPEDIPEDLSSPQKPTSDSAKDKHTDTTSSWNEKNKEADPVEEEIEIDVVEVEADPDSDIDIEGEDEVDEQTHVLAGDLDKTKAGNEVSASPPREQTTSILPAKTTEPDAHKHGSDNPDAVTGAADLNLSFYDKSTSAKKTSPDRKSAGTRSFSADDVMEGVENVDIGSRRRKNSDAGESPSAEHAGSAEVRSEGSGSDNMAPREVDNSATARDKRRKSDTIWSPWK